MLVSPFAFQTATIAALRERPHGRLAGLYAHGRLRSGPCPLFNGKNGRFTTWKKNFL